MASGENMVEEQKERPMVQYKANESKPKVKGGAYE